MSEEVFRDDRAFNVVPVGGVVGFTGTRKGMTTAQKSSVEWLLRMLVAMTFGHMSAEHGDCVGADKDFDDICASLGLTRWCRPCTLEGLRAFSPARQIASPAAPMERNRAIVADACVMIGCPPNFKKIESGSGTWATIGFAEKAGRPTFIVFPDGTMDIR